MLTLLALASVVLLGIGKSTEEVFQEPFSSPAGELLLPLMEAQRLDQLMKT